MLVAPSDHIIPDVEEFRNSVFCALPAAQAGNIVTFGIVPSSPETGYCYLELAADANPRMNEIQRVVRVVEKPNYARACEMHEGGNFLWNAGVFLTKASTMVSAFEEHAAEMVPLVRRSLEEAGRSSNVITLAAEPWGKLPYLSIDYAVMAESNNLYVMPYSGRWSDLGCWQAVMEVCEKDKMGNVVAGNSLAIDCQGTMLRSESENMIVVGVGLRDLVAIATPDAILVAHASEAQRVEDAAQELKSRGARQATSFHFDRRPWGRFETLANGSGYHVKRIVVEPGAALSLQSHKFRAEHWIVVQGTARVTVNESVSILEVNEHIYIPLGAIHRLENSEDGELVLIEVQTGSYFGEDDIIRYEDMYSRILRTGLSDRKVIQRR
jgi:mannose-1-phosphate guanylyltransferase/mannose-6-phosphate isomerase